MARRERRRQTKPSPDDLLARVEQLAESLLDISAEERRMLKTLARLRSIRGGLVAALAQAASAIAEAES